MTATLNGTVMFGELEIAQSLYNFVNDEVIPDSEVKADDFWNSLAAIVRDLGPKNAALLAKRDALQAQIDGWHRAHRNRDAASHKAFLQEIGYLADEVEDFSVSTRHVDAEIAEIAGPQLVVPLDNSRYALNAANARWGSLYDALYGTNAIPESDGCKKTKKYNPIRGDKVIAFARGFLDRHFGLEQGTHNYATLYRVVDGLLVVCMGDGSQCGLLRPERLVGYTGDPERPDKILLCKNGLHVELRFGEGYFIGRKDHASIYDIHLESVISTIMDCEDSVASVDVEDKLSVYRNWLGLMQGTLVRMLEKDGETVERRLKADREYKKPNGDPLTCHGRSLMLVRNVGMHLDTHAVTFQGKPIPETMLDAMVTVLAAKHDLLGHGKYRNSREGSVYIVKPKMHGPEEVALANELFLRVEQALGLERNTLKMGIMDEERRTSVNLKACIQAVRERIFFINTGFLDRTGDDIHSNMEAGPMLPKAEMKTATWQLAYEDSNVDIGLACGLMGHAQIGKGMWAMPEEMAAMLETKIMHPKAGANTAWVPSPTAATLHAMHYHLLEVTARQKDLIQRSAANVDDILTIPVMSPERTLTAAEINRELENNAQGILGYVARWVGQGVGCSKVPDINNIELMEDCATLRISSQHIANWLYHGIYTEAQVCDTMARMAVLVDRQNAGDPAYQPMSDDYASSLSFQAALDLVLKGREQPNGYTEFVLTARRREVKAS